MRKLLSFCGGMIALGAALVAVNPPSLAYLLIASTAPPPAYVGPGDITSFTGWWGLRAYTAAIAAAGTQPLINITRASDSHACDVLVATNGGLGLTSSCGTGGDNGQSASSFCNTTTCQIDIMYDQTGSGRPLNSKAAQPAFPLLVFNCINTTLPCASSDAGVGRIIATSGNYTPISQQLSISYVALNVSPGTTPQPFQENNTNNYVQVTAANTWTYVGGNAGSVASTLADDAFHASNIAVDLTPNTSTFNGDGTETTATNLNNSVTAGLIIAIRSLASGTIKQTEAGFIDGVVMPLSSRSKLCDNQGSYWGTSKGTHCNSSGT